MMPLPAKVFLFIQIARYFGYNYARWMIFFTEYVEEEGRKKGKSASSE